MTDEQRRQLIEQIAGTLPLPREIQSDFAAFTADTVMGGLWTRGGLAPRERSLITIAALTALGRTSAIELNIRMALGNGATKEEILEAMIQMAPYAGFPAAWEGLQIASRVFGG